MPSHTLLYTPSLSVREPVFLSLFVQTCTHTHTHTHTLTGTPAHPHAHTHAQTGAGTNIRRNRRFSCDRTSLRRSETSETKKIETRGSHFFNYLGFIFGFSVGARKTRSGCERGCPLLAEASPLPPGGSRDFFFSNCEKNNPDKKSYFQTRSESRNTVVRFLICSTKHPSEVFLFLWNEFKVDHSAQVFYLCWLHLTQF